MSILEVTIGIIEYQFSSQQLVSEIKVDEGQYVEDRKFYDKVRGREVQWQRKLQLMAKEGKGVLMQKGLHKTLQGKSAKAAGTSNEDWKEIAVDSMKS